MAPFSLRIPLPPGALLEEAKWEDMNEFCRNAPPWRQVVYYDIGGDMSAILTFDQKVTQKQVMEWADTSEKQARNW